LPRRADGQYEDEQQVSVAGIVQNVKMKTTKNNSMMAYVTLEDDTGAMEMLVFSTALGLYGSYLRENQAIVVVKGQAVRPG
jgi:DNA polymerase-3 subunit alpha